MADTDTSGPKALAPTGEFASVDEILDPERRTARTLEELTEVLDQAGLTELGAQDPDLQILGERLVDPEGRGRDDPFEELRRLTSSVREGYEAVRKTDGTRASLYLAAAVALIDVFPPKSHRRNIVERGLFKYEGATQIGMDLLNWRGSPDNRNMAYLQIAEPVRGYASRVMVRDMAELKMVNEASGV